MLAPAAVVLLRGLTIWPLTGMLIASLMPFIALGPLGPFSDPLTLFMVEGGRSGAGLKLWCGEDTAGACLTEKSAL